jgi:hypothetical protein
LLRYPSHPKTHPRRAIRGNHANHGESLRVTPAPIRAAIVFTIARPGPNTGLSGAQHPVEAVKDALWLVRRNTQPVSSIWISVKPASCLIDKPMRPPVRRTADRNRPRSSGASSGRSRWQAPAHRHPRPADVLMKRIRKGIRPSSTYRKMRESGALQRTSPTAAGARPAKPAR